MTIQYDAGVVNNAREMGEAVTGAVQELAKNTWSVASGWVLDQMAKAGIGPSAARPLWQAGTGALGSNSAYGITAGAGAGPVYPDGSYPIVGGQCSTEVYSVAVRYNRPTFFSAGGGNTFCRQVALTAQNSPFLGPIYKVAIEPSPTNPAILAAVVTHNDGSGGQRKQGLIGIAEDTNCGAPYLTGVDIDIIGSQPDVCGNAPNNGTDVPPLPESDRSVDVDVEVNIDNSNNPSYTIPIVAVGVGVFANGQVYVDADVDATARIRVPLGFNLNFNGGGGGETGAPETGPGAPEPIEPPVKRLCGLIIVTSNPGGGKGETFLTGGQIYYHPRLGSVNFRYRMNNQVFSGPDIEVHKDFMFIPAPPTCDAPIGWDSNPYLGTEWTITPYYSYPLNVPYSQRL